MGQDYKFCNLQTKECVTSYDYDNLAKLLEHSWIQNHYVNVAEKLISKKGKWFGQAICWAGDYSPNELGEEENLYDICGRNIIKPRVGKYRYFRFLINKTKKEFVDLDKVPVSSINENEEYRLHPLPLLTCEGNKRGGGDFYGEDPTNLIGSWARCVIEPTKRKPTADFSEIIFDLKV